MKTVVISDNVDTFIGLRAVGIDGVVFSKSEDIIAAFNAFAADESVGIILITDKVNETCSEFFMNFKLTHRKPLITVIPGRDGSNTVSGSVTDYFNEAVL